MGYDNECAENYCEKDNVCQNKYRSLLRMSVCEGMESAFRKDGMIKQLDLFLMWAHEST
jgi:hypothetical protein